MNCGELMRAKNGKGMARGDAPAKEKFAKTDFRYWESRVYFSKYREAGGTCQSKTYTVRIQHAGKRRSFNTGESSKRAAGKEAAKIFVFLRANGWEATLDRFCPSQAPQEDRVTVGDYIREVESIATIAPRTLGDYKRSFRKIVSEAQGIQEATDDDGQPRSRFDYRNGGRDAWVARVDRVFLDQITPAKIQKWKKSRVARAGSDPLKIKSARISANSIMRQAKSLFGARKVLPFVTKSLALPDPLPFDGVDFFPRTSMRYASRIDVPELIRSAREEFVISSRPEDWASLEECERTAWLREAKGKQEAWKIFLLALGAGLCRREIDNLLWKHFDFEEGNVQVQATEHYGLKNEARNGCVDLEPEMVEIFQDLKSRSKGIFVIESDLPPRPGASYSYTRSGPHFERLYQWLRAQGVEDRKPLHTLRKEFGSLVCAKHGLYAASQALRHADIAVTASYYVDRKESVTPGIGAALEI